MSKSQRVKGAVGEREWIALLKKYGFEGKRNLDQTRDGGGDVLSPPFLWEVKRRRGIAVYKWVKQVVAAVNGALTPVVAARADNEDWLVIVSADAFLQLAAFYRANRPNEEGA